jgi:hypothetical protein
MSLPLFTGMRITILRMDIVDKVLPPKTYQKYAELAPSERETGEHVLLGHSENLVWVVEFRPPGKPDAILNIFAVEPNMSLPYKSVVAFEDMLRQKGLLRPEGSPVIFSPMVYEKDKTLGAMIKQNLAEGKHWSNSLAF